MESVKDMVLEDALNVVFKDESKIQRQKAIICVLSIICVFLAVNRHGKKCD